MRSASIALAMLLLAFALGCKSQPNATEERTPVRGSVKVAGKLAPGLIVRFHLEPGTADQRASSYVETLTDAEGAFRISQTLPDDGLAPGKYVVTFFWPPGGGSDSPESTDQLKSRYINPAKSQFRVTIQPSSNELPPFELK